MNSTKRVFSTCDNFLKKVKHSLLFPNTPSYLLVAYFIHFEGSDIQILLTIPPFISAVTRYLCMGLCIVVSLTYKYNVLEHADALGTDLDSSCTKCMEGIGSKPVTGTCAAPVANIRK